MITDCGIFCLWNVVWQCSTEGHEDFFQGNFANNNTYGWRGLWQFTTKINLAKLDGNLQLMFAIAAKVEVMI